MLINILSPFPLSTTFVSPVTTNTPALSQLSFIPTKISQNSDIGRPSSIIKLSDRYFGIAPHMAISLTVPFTANSPMLPPGKKIGEITKLSVEKANSPFISKNAPSCLLSNLSFFNILKTPLSNNLFVSSPPLPCPKVIKSKSNFGIGQDNFIFIFLLFIISSTKLLNF